MAVKIRSQPQSKRFHAMKLLGTQGKHRSGDVYLNVTALVDMMTVLVIFLVMNFNASGEMSFVSKDIKIPQAAHGDALTRVPIVSLSRNGDLYFEGSIIVADLGSRADDVDWRIAELEEKLVDNRQRFEVVRSGQSANLPPEEDPTTTVNVQADESVDFKLLKRVLHTAELAGYGRIHLAVGDSRKAAEDEANAAATAPE